MPGVLLLSEQGRPPSAMVAARRLLGRVAAREDVPATLRSLYARQALADPDEPVVTTLVLADGGRLVLTADRAGEQIVVVVETDHLDPFESTLTPLEREVAELVLQGLSTKRMAALLQIRGWTVQQHLKSVFAKCRVTSRVEVVNSATSPPKKSSTTSSSPRPLRQSLRRRRRPRRRMGRHQRHPLAHYPQIKRQVDQASDYAGIYADIDR